QGIRGMAAHRGGRAGECCSSTDANCRIIQHLADADRVEDIARVGIEDPNLDRDAVLVLAAAQTQATDGDSALMLVRAGVGLAHRAFEDVTSSPKLVLCGIAGCLTRAVELLFIGNALVESVALDH